MVKWNYELLSTIPNNLHNGVEIFYKLPKLKFFVLDNFNHEINER